jgi:hypothetical protein
MHSLNLGHGCVPLLLRVFGGRLGHTSYRHDNGGEYGKSNHGRWSTPPQQCPPSGKQEVDGEGFEVAKSGEGLPMVSESKSHNSPSKREPTVTKAAGGNKEGGHLAEN